MPETVDATEYETTKERGGGKVTTIAFRENVVDDGVADNENYDLFTGQYLWFGVSGDFVKISLDIHMF